MKLQGQAGNRAVQRLVQRKATGDDALFNIPDVRLPSPGGGSPLPDGVRGKMESAFGHDFSDVRVHEDASAESVGARAYTRGNEIHVAQGLYNPSSNAGQSLIGHELTHVVQQRAGVVASPPQASGVPVNADTRLEDEADRAGQRAASHQSADTGAAGSSQASGRAAAQLQPLDEDEIQGSWVAQRQALDEDELTT